MLSRNCHGYRFGHTFRCGDQTNEGLRSRHRRRVSANQQSALLKIRQKRCVEGEAASCIAAD